MRIKFESSFKRRHERSLNAARYAACRSMRKTIATNIAGSRRTRRSRSAALRDLPDQQWPASDCGRNGAKLRLELITRGDVHGNDPVWQPALLQHDGDFLAVARADTLADDPASNDADAPATFFTAPVGAGRVALSARPRLGPDRVLLDDEECVRRTISISRRTAPASARQNDDPAKHTAQRLVFRTVPIRGERKLRHLNSGVLKNWSRLHRPEQLPTAPDG